MRFKFPIEECDISNRKSLLWYRAARVNWLSWLDQDEHHAVWKQITAMVWNDAVYRTVNECRRFSKAEAPTAASNGMLGELINIGYVGTQVLAIWKLMDRRDDVISLRRLFDSISCNRHLLTRENYVAYDGLPYDPEAAKNAFYAGMAPDEIQHLRGLPREGPQAFAESELLHLAFDRISGVAPEKRSRKDRISSRVFETIGNWFKDPVFERLTKLRHNFVAHAADEQTRSAVGLTQIGVTLGEIEKAHQLIVSSAQVISAQLLYGASHGQVVPIPQFDQFAALDAQFVPTDAINELSSWWHHHMDSRAAWTSFGAG